MFSPNESETFEYTGITPKGSETCLKAAIALAARVDAKYIIFKLGARGAFCFDGKHMVTIPAYHATEVVDTTAAGDTFTAAMTLKYLETKDIIGSIKYGAAAAAIAVSRKGAGESVPTEAEVIDFINKQTR